MLLLATSGVNIPSPEFQAMEKEVKVVWVGIVAEAGTGKSCLCFEFTQRCCAQGLLLLEGQAVAHGKNLPLLPILQVFRAYRSPARCGIPPGPRDPRAPSRSLERDRSLAR
jgi:hypothetical protein